MKNDNSSPFGFFLLLVIAVPISSFSSAFAQPHPNLPGYNITPFVNLPKITEDIEFDGLGNLYVPTSPDGIRRIVSWGGISLWSTAPAWDLASTGLGTFVGAGRNTCNCLYDISSDGTYRSFLNGYAWTWVATDPNSGVMYSSVWAGPGQGLYRFDLTGAVAPIVTGGPGAGGAGFYRGMSFGVDGNLYTVGSDDYVSFGLFRLDENKFTRVAVLPHGGSTLTRDSAGVFYTTGVDSNSVGEVWMIDSTSGLSSLLASGFADPFAVGFNSSSSILYVADRQGNRTIWAITYSTPVNNTTWGNLKNRYR